MFLSTANSKAGCLGLTVLVLAVAGWLVQPLEIQILHPIDIRAEQLSAVGGQGGVLARLGGIRSTMASACWLRTNLAWERRDTLATTALIELTVALDERPLYFWLNGARMIACDMPDWRRNALAPSAWQVRVNEEQAQLALRLLEKGLRWHGPDATLYIEMANIHLRRRNDREMAAHYYRLAAEQPDAPYYAARIHGELLRELGRPEEALKWLRRVLPSLDAYDPQARREVVVERIKMLEQQMAASPHPND